MHKPQVKGTQGEYSSTSKPPEVICYRCQSPGHIAKDCPTKRFLKFAHLEPKYEVSDSFTKMEDSFTRMDKLCDDLINMLRAGSMKEKELLDAKEQTSNSKLHVSTKQKIVSPSENLDDQLERSHTVSSNSMTVLTHLSSAQKVENISGTNMEIKEQELDLAAKASPTLDKKVDEGLVKEEPRPEA